MRRKQPIIQKASSAPVPLQDFSAKDAVWLFARDPADLDEKEQITLTAICQASETAKQTYELIQEFRHLLHHREGNKLDEWLMKVRASQIHELQSFVFGVERDKVAVGAELTLIQNNGLIEGKVTSSNLSSVWGTEEQDFHSCVSVCFTPCKPLERTFHMQDYPVLINKRASLKVSQILQFRQTTILIAFEEMN